MIQIKAPDGSIVQFPDGTGDDVITGVMQKNFPAPAAPDLAAVGATAQRDLVQQPGVLDAQNAKDLATLAPQVAPQPTTWVDKLKSLVAPSPAATPTATPAAAAPDDGRMHTSDGVIGTAAYAPRGVRRGLATIAGLPVDLTNTVLSLAGAPVSPTPFGGKESIDKYLLRAGGLIPDLAEPDTFGKRITNRIGEEVGAASVPVAAAIGKAGQVGIQGARELPTLARMFVEPAAINPAKFASKEGATAFAAGTGAAAAGELSHASGIDPQGAAHQTLDILGALAGAGSLGAARIVGKPLDDVRQAIFSRDKFSNNTVKENIVDRIINNSETLPKTEGQAIDTAPLVEAITGGKRVDAVIPGFRDSIADRTADPGLATLEYGRQSGPNAGEFVKRRTDNTNAVDAAMDRNKPNGNPADLRSELDLERTRQQTDAGVHTQNATDDFNRATQALQPAMTGEGRGADIRSALEHASFEARQILREAWEPLNKSKLQTDLKPLADKFENIRDGMSTAEAERFSLPEMKIPERLSGEREITPMKLGPDGEVIEPALTETIKQPFREITGLRSALTDAAREARTNGLDNQARIIDDHIGALDKFLDGRLKNLKTRQNLDNAREATADFHDRFTRPQTAIAQTLNRREGMYRQPDSAVAQKFVQADEGRISDFHALMKEAGSDERTVAAVRDQILADVKDRGLLTKPDQLGEYLNGYKTILADERFAGVRSELDNAAGLRRSVDQATAKETQLGRELGTADKPGTSTVGKYLQYGDERAQDALKGVIASKKPGEAIDELLSFAGNKPEAVEGARKAFWDLVESRTRSNGETTKTLDGKQPWMPNRLNNFLDDPAHAAVAERLYRDNPEHLANVRQIAEELAGVDLRSRGKASNTSGTAQGVSNVLTPETLQSRFYAYKRGQTSLGFMLTALGSVAARRLVRGAQGEAIEKLLDRALLDPDLAAQLLKEHNPANRAALARTAKTYLGNEASTLTDIIDPDTKKDDVKDAIMRNDSAKSQ